MKVFYNLLLCLGLTFLHACDNFHRIRQNVEIPSGGSKSQSTEGMTDDQVMAALIANHKSTNGTKDGTELDLVELLNVEGYTFPQSYWENTSIHCPGGEDDIHGIEIKTIRFTIDTGSFIIQTAGEPDSEWLQNKVREGLAKNIAAALGIDQKDVEKGLTIDNEKFQKIVASAREAIAASLEGDETFYLAFLFQVEDLRYGHSFDKSKKCTILKPVRKDYSKSVNKLIIAVKKDGVEGVLVKLAGVQDLFGWVSPSVGQQLGVDAKQLEELTTCSTNWVTCEAP